MTCTVIVLGAGASADFGIPLGAKLYEIMSKRLQNFLVEFDSMRERQFIVNAHHFERLANKAEFSGVAEISKLDDGGYDLEKITSLLQIVENAPVYSVDTLALEYPEFTNFCRKMTISILKDAIIKGFNKDKNNTENWIYLKRNIQSLSDRTATIENWLHLFVSMMRNSVTLNPEHKFEFISFNYDGITENSMRRIWDFGSRDIAEFDDVALFHYPHGKLNWKNESTWGTSLSADNDQILFAHNKSNIDSFSSSHLALQDADEIISLGFHFAPENVASLNMAEICENKSAIVQNFDSNQGLTRRAKRIQWASSNIFSGSISRAIRQGILGELPS